MQDRIIGLDISVLGARAPREVERPRMTLRTIAAAVAALPFDEAKVYYRETIQRLSADVTRDIANYIGPHGHPSSGVSAGEDKIAFKGKLSFDGGYLRGNRPRNQGLMIDYRPDGTLIPHRERRNGDNLHRYILTLAAETLRADPGEGYRAEATVSPFFSFSAQHSDIVWHVVATLPKARE